MYINDFRTCLITIFGPIRPFICPNEGFLLQLAMFEYEILGGLSVSSRTSKQWNFYAINE
jgi:hypothetical protein